MRLLIKTLNLEFIRFILTGALNTAVGYLLYAVSYYFSGHEGFALAVDYILGALFNYKSYSMLVFSRYTKKRFIAFCLVYVFTYFMNYLTLKALIGIAELNAYLAQLLALTIFPLLLYLLLKRFVFINRAS